MLKPIQCEVRVASKKRLARDVLLVTLAFSRGAQFRFHAGQYIVLKIPVNAEVLDRPFSIASDPHAPTRIQLIVKLVPGGTASEFLTSATLGDHITLTGPHGSFGIRSHRRPIRMIAAGTGIAPLRSMLFELSARPAHPPVMLEFLVTDRWGAILADELRRIKSKDKRFNYRVETEGLRYLEAMSIGPNEDVYLCGGWHFVTDAAAIISRRGILRARIHFERFT